jgi:hypothetical protein
MSHSKNFQQMFTTLLHEVGNVILLLFIIRNNFLLNWTIVITWGLALLSVF